MICPKCKYHNPDDYLFCCECGAKLEKVSAAIQKPAQRRLACPNPECGSTDLPADSLFCPDCGWKLKAKSELKPVMIRVKGVAYKLIKVDGGTFDMKESVPHGKHGLLMKEVVQHTTLTEFCIGETLVTQALWTAVMGRNPSMFKGEMLPVDHVSWNDCQKFIHKLESLTGRKFRLPTEAEWEFAARGGTSSMGYRYSGGNNLDLVAWYAGNSDNKPHPVASKMSNELGLYDMSGNVWEWCMDLYSNYNNEAVINPLCMMAKDGDSYVIRGGCWGNDETNCLSTVRYYNHADYKGRYIGFRLCLSE